VYAGRSVVGQELAVVARDGQRRLREDLLDQIGRGLAPATAVEQAHQRRGSGGLDTSWTLP